MAADHPRAIALDIHTHLVPVSADGLSDIDGVGLVDGELEVDGHRIGVEALYRPDRLIDWMARFGIERALISPPPPTYRLGLTAPQAARWAAYLNLGLAEIAAASAGRLIAAAYLPLEHPDAAVQIANEAIASGSAFFTAPAAPFGGLTFSDEALDPLWATLDRAGAFLFLHPGTCCDGRLRPFYLENLLGNPYETAVAAAHLVFGGVVARHPNIRFALAHGGGATAMVAGRWQRGVDTARPGIDTDTVPPAATLKRFLVDSIVHDSAALDLVASVFGHDNILFGSDWPFPMGIPDPTAQLSAVDPALRRRILYENAQPFFQNIQG